MNFELFRDIFVFFRGIFVLFRGDFNMIPCKLDTSNEKLWIKKLSEKPKFALRKVIHPFFEDKYKSQELVSPRKRFRDHILQ